MLPLHFGASFATTLAFLVRLSFRKVPLVRLVSRAPLYYQIFINSYCRNTHSGPFYSPLLFPNCFHSRRRFLFSYFNHFIVQSTCHTEYPIVLHTFLQVNFLQLKTCNWVCSWLRFQLKLFVFVVLKNFFIFFIFLFFENIF